MNKTIQLKDLGIQDFKKTWDYQDAIFNKIIHQKIQNRRDESNIETDNFFLFVEHPHVYTLGKSGDRKSVV